MGNPHIKEDEDFIVLGNKKVRVKTDEELKESLKKAIKKHGWNPKEKIPIIKIREKENSLFYHLKNRSKLDFGYLSVGRILQKYGYEPYSLSKKYINNYFKETLSPSVVNYIFNRDIGDEKILQSNLLNTESELIFKLRQKDNPKLTKEKYKQQLKIGKRVKEVLVGDRNDIEKIRKTKQIPLEAMIKGLYPKLEEKYQLKLYDALIQKKILSEESINEKLTRWFYEGKGITGDMLRLNKGGTTIHSRIKEQKQNKNIIDFGNVGFQTKEAIRLRNKIPSYLLNKTQSKYKNIFSSVENYNDELENTFEKARFMLEIARLYDPDLDKLPILKKYLPEGDLKKIIIDKSENGNYIKSLEPKLIIVAGEKKTKKEYEFTINEITNLKGKKEISTYIKDPKIKFENLFDEEGINKAYLGEKKLEEAYDEAMRLLLQKEPFFFDAADKYTTITERITKHLDIPGIKVKDIEDNTFIAKKITGDISEYEVGNLFSIIKKYDPNMTLFPELKKYLDQPLLKIIRNNERNEVKLGNEDLIQNVELGEDTPSNGESDFKLLSGRKSYAIEVKNYAILRPERIRKIYEKHFSVHNWADGTPIDKKILMFNGHTYNLDKYIKKLEAGGLEVMPSEMTTNAYQQAIRLLFEKEPQFFDNVSTVIAGNNQEKLEKLLHLHDLNHNKTHLMRRNGNKFQSRWYLSLLRDVYNTLEHREQSLNPKQDIQKEYIIPFSYFKDKYHHSVDLSYVNKNTIFFDLETCGFIRTGNIINMIGMAYELQGEMVSHVIFIRDPTEEKAALEKFQNIASNYEYIAGFNSKRFDIHYANERFITNLIKLTLNNKHIDMLDYWMPIAKQLKFPKATLQTFERTIMKSNVREADVQGKDIPQYYNEYILGLNAEPIRQGITHNHFDNISNVLLFKYLVENKKIDLMVSGNSHNYRK